jgi:beta-glucosidase
MNRNFQNFFLSATFFIVLPIFLYAQTETTIQNRIETKVDSVIKLMTLEEKVGQLNQYNGSWDVTGPLQEDDNYNKRKKSDLESGYVGSMLNVISVEATREAQKIAVENSRLGIPLIFGLDVIHGYKTIFPVPLAESCSWDLDLIEKTARIAAVEASAAGLHWTFAPMVDICRDPRWGRIMEGAGEDPYLASEIAKARVKGFQGDILSQHNTIVACAKHFAAYGAVEGGRDYNTVDMSLFNLHNIYLPPFKACIDAKVGTFMNAFTSLNGIPATGNQYLVNQLLKTKWQFDGFVVSDWGSVGELLNHKTARDSADAARIAALGKTDMDMESQCYRKFLVDLVQSGKVPESYINEAVKRILRIKFRLGLFDDPFKYCSEKREREFIGKDEHINISRDIARKSIVLLKNEENLLPLDTKIKTLAIIGPLAKDKDTPLGNWRCQGGPDNAVSLFEGIQSAVHRNVKILYARGCKIVEKTGQGFIQKLRFAEKDTSAIGEAVEIAKKSDVVILAVGETAYMSGEARSRANINLPGAQQKLVNKIYRTGKPIILVLMNGRPLNITHEASQADAVLESWHLGSQAGNAIADVLFGNYNPSGKLTVTFPRTVGQIPVYYNHFNTGRPLNDSDDLLQAKYIDILNKPLFPFGYGLSYTTFEYSKIGLNKQKMTMDDTLKLKITVKNNGNFDGHEVVQLYIRDITGSFIRPIKELKGFQKVFLEKGESKEVVFTLTEKDFSFYNNEGKLVVEPGEFKVAAGANSQDLQVKSFQLIE